MRPETWPAPNRIESILGGCAIQENWQGTRGANGTSLNLYAPDGKWHQIWVDSQGNLVEVAGGLEEGKMVMRGTSPSQAEPGKTVLHRATWTPLDGGRVHSLWEASRDDGKTWTVQFDGMYSRRVGPGQLDRLDFQPREAFTSFQAVTRVGDPHGAGSTSKKGKRAQSRKMAPSLVAAASATPGRTSFRAQKAAL